MKKIFLIFNLIILIPYIIVSLFINIETKKFYFIKDVNVRIKRNENIVEVPLEEYIIGVVSAEMPASFELEALKAQAVAARTYAIYQLNTKRGNYNVTDTIDDQVYLTEQEMQEKWDSDYDKYYQKVYTAVKDTKDQVIKQNDKIIKAFFFSMSNGYTEDSITVFKEGNLEGVESKWDNETLNNFEVTTEFSINELKEKLSITDENIDVKVLTRSDTNRVTSVKVNNKTYTGIEFRKLLTLRSTDFTLEKTDKGYNITTKGYGHGVGMSQYGANGMAKEGYLYDEILKYY